VTYEVKSPLISASFVETGNSESVSSCYEAVLILPGAREVLLHCLEFVCPLSHLSYSFWSLLSNPQRDLPGATLEEVLYLTFHLSTSMNERFRFVLTWSTDCVRRMRSFFTCRLSKKSSLLMPFFQFVLYWITVINILNSRLSWNLVRMPFYQGR
jgi:hypothetical protein